MLTVPPYYYADNLRLFTEELIYIPLGPVGEFSDEDKPDMLGMNFYVTMPGVIYADKVIVQSENIKSHYVDKLVEFCAGTDRGYWEKKIVSKHGNVADGNNSKRKRILYGISSYEYYEYKENFKEVISSRIAIFTENKEKVQATIYLYPSYDAKFADVNNAFYSADYNEFCKTVINLASESGIEIVDGISPTYSAISALAGSFDAYYGSSLPIVQEFVMQKKPVMIADYSV